MSPSSIVITGFNNPVQERSGIVRNCNYNLFNFILYNYLFKVMNTAQYFFPLRRNIFIIQEANKIITKIGVLKNYIIKISSNIPRTYYYQISYPLARFSKRNNNELEDHNPDPHTEHKNNKIINYKISCKKIFLYQENENNSNKSLCKYIFNNIYKLICKVASIRIFIKIYNIRKEKPNKIKPHL